VGKFVFESSIKVDIEDRALAHLKLAITTKLRRGESFCFSWRDDASIGDGRTTVWLNPTSNIVFKFYGSRPPQLNPAWIDALTFVANTPNGLHLVPEPAPPAHAPAKPAHDLAYY
jgi:hypothetical protein